MLSKEDRQNIDSCGTESCRKRDQICLFSITASTDSCSAVVSVLEMELFLSTLHCIQTYFNSPVATSHLKVYEEPLRTQLKSLKNCVCLCTYI